MRASRFTLVAAILLPQLFAAVTEKSLGDPASRPVPPKILEYAQRSEEARQAEIKRLMGAMPANRRARMSVKQKLKALRDRSEPYYAPMGKQGADGRMGMLADLAEVLQVIDGRNMLIEVVTYHTYMFPSGSLDRERVRLRTRTRTTRTTYWLTGIATGGIADEQSYELNGVFEVSGTKTYRNLDGVACTVPIMKRVDLAPYRHLFMADSKTLADHAGGKPRALSAKAVADVPRTWTDASGKHKTVAAFLSYTAGNVKLRKENGKVITVPIDKLSKGDREWIQKQAKRKR